MRFIGPELLVLLVEGCQPCQQARPSLRAPGYQDTTTVHRTSRKKKSRKGLREGRLIIGVIQRFNS